MEGPKLPQNDPESLSKGHMAWVSESLSYCWSASMIRVWCRRLVLVPVLRLAETAARHVLLGSL